MSKSTKTQNQQIPVESMNEFCVVSEKVEIASAYTETKYKNIQRPAGFTFAVQNVKTYEIGFIELERDFFDAKKDDQFVSVYTYMKDSKKAKIFEKRMFLKKFIKIVTTLNEIAQ